MGRRGLLGLGAALGLGACGFRPLYRESEGRFGPTVVGVPDLEKVRVAAIAERNGQLLRRALQQRLPGGGEGPGGRYDLRIGLSFASDIQGFNRDGTPTRVRVTATANWFLFDQATPPQLVTRGVERAFDAYNLPENQFFASDVAREAMEQRLMEQLAQEIVQHLAVQLEARGTQTAG